MNKWRYIPFATYNGFQNMAIDEFLLDHIGENQIPNTLRFYQWYPSTASIGLNQSLSAEIDFDAAKRQNVDVVRRISGGGAVYHDSKGEITYGVICREKDLPTQFSSNRIYDDKVPLRYQVILEALAQGLESIGFPVDTGAIHCPALLTNGKKISGNAQAIRKGTLLQHGTVLLTVNPEMMYSVLKAPVGVNYTKMVKSVRSKVTGILQENVKHEKNISNEVIVQAMKKGFEKVFNITFEEKPFTNEEWHDIEKIASEKYRSQQWTAKYP